MDHALRMPDEQEVDSRPRLRIAFDHAEPVRVGKDVSFVCRGDLPRFDLQRRPSLRLILIALVERRISAAGGGLTQEELFAAGWPGQHIRARSAAARVYTAVNTLRRAALDGVLVRRGHLYELDASVPLLEIDP